MGCTHLIEDWEPPMGELSEPAADAALDEGSEPPAVCRVCFTQLEEDEGSMCPLCEEQADAAAFDRYVDWEIEDAWYDKRSA